MTDPVFLEANYSYIHNPCHISDLIYRNTERGAVSCSKIQRKSALCTSSGRYIKCRERKRDIRPDRDLVKYYQIAMSFTIMRSPAPLRAGWAA